MKSNFCDKINALLVKALAKNGYVEIHPKGPLMLVFRAYRHASISAGYLFECIKFAEDEGLQFEDLTIQREGMGFTVKLIFGVREVKQG